MMTGEEARLILGVTEKTSWEDIVKKFETMFEKNTKSFYLQSKIHRAKEFLETLQ
ncbi:import inner membrane translocase subunit tim16-like protein [Medicago truncatula]|uniref:Import inner membrane translocase subunit tim16-like protein n=2 Tax=Medicago truncatula TaxID=3880 RepID=G7IBX0_MEDTR|nr:import inner membrane translocase subunit tim16-like protein [Medicago truncatula]